MRLCIIIGVIVLHVGSYAQTQDGNSVLLQDTVLQDLPLTKGELRDKTKEWIGKTFKSGKDVISSDTESSIVGHFIANTYGSFGLVMDWEHTLSVDFKDGKARVKIWVDRALHTNKDNALLPSTQPASAYWYGKHKPTKLHAKWLVELVENSGGLTRDLHKSLNGKPDDW